MTGQRMGMIGWLLVAACCGQAHAEGMPEHVRKALDRFVGKWHVEDVVEGKTTTAEFEGEWTPDKSALTYRWSGRGLIGQLPSSAFGTLGWDGGAMTVRERNFGADGSTFEATHAIEPGATEWKSPAQGTFAKDGGFLKSTATRAIRWTNDDEWVAIMSDRKVDGQDAPAVVTTCRRAKSEAARHLDFWKPMVGNWKTKSQVGGKDVVGTSRLELSPSQCCLVSVGAAEGQPAGHSIWAYDPALRAWKIVGFDAAGGSSTLVVHVSNMDEMKQMRAGVKGTYETYRSLVNGTTETETGDWNVPSWDDKQYVLEITGIVKNGQPQPDVKIHYERQ